MVYNSDSQNVGCEEPAGGPQEVTDCTHTTAIFLFKSHSGLEAQLWLCCVLDKWRETDISLSFHCLHNDQQLKTTSLMTHQLLLQLTLANIRPLPRQHYCLLVLHIMIRKEVVEC